MMRSLKTAAVAAMMFASAAMPALGAVVINAANSGYNFQIDYAGQVDGSPYAISGLQTFTFDSVSNNGLTYNFSYSLFNDSIENSRIRSFGFDTTGTISGQSATGDYAFASQDGMFPDGLGTRDLCFRATGNGTCNGGPGGLDSNPDELGGGTFAITFSQVMESVTFDNFALRFQSVGPNQADSGVGIGSVVQGGGGGDPIVAPEPGTWLMLLGGFGLVGYAMRRRRSSAAAHEALARAA